LEINIVEVNWHGKTCCKFGYLFGVNAKNDGQDAKKKKKAQSMNKKEQASRTALLFTWPLAGYCRLQFRSRLPAFDPHVLHFVTPDPFHILIERQLLPRFEVAAHCAGDGGDTIPKLEASRQSPKPASFDLRRVSD